MLNREDIKWFVIHTRPHQENKVKTLLETEQDKRPNIMEIYCPSNKILKMQKGKRIEEVPLFAARVFVLTTEKDANLFLTEKYPDGFLEYDKTQKRVMTIPELQMLFFMDFNEHYPEQVLVLERPYSDYAFNAKNDEPNEIIMVMDGPFAGKTGYLVRFRRERRLVFQMEDMAVSIPDIWDYHLTRLHNQQGDRQSKYTQKGRAIDYIVGLLQGCGFQKSLGKVFGKMISSLAEKPSLNQLCQQLRAEQDAARKMADGSIEQDAANKEVEENEPIDGDYAELISKINGLSQYDASTIISLASYAKKHPEVTEACHTLSIRPFLTPTSGIAPMDGKEYGILEHERFTEYIFPTTLMEATYFANEEKQRTVAARYYAHVGIQKKKNGNTLVFVNWDEILREYFYLVGEAKAKQLDTFSKYSPILYKVLAGQDIVKAEKDLLLDNGNVQVLAIHVKTEEASSDAEVKEAINQLTETCKAICQEINSSTHLANWRKYLRSIWLHN